MELIKYENDVATLEPKVSDQIADLERQIKILAEKESKIKQVILEEMESKGIIKLDTDSIVITYVAEADRENFDKKKFREEYPDIYDNYITMSPVKSCIKIKVK